MKTIKIISMFFFIMLVLFLFFLTAKATSNSECSYHKDCSDGKLCNNLGFCVKKNGTCITHEECPYKYWCREGLCVESGEEGDYCVKETYKSCRLDLELTCTDNKCAKMNTWGTVVEPTFPSETKKKESRILGFIFFICSLIFVSAIIILLIPFKIEKENKVKKYSRKIVALGSIIFSFMFLSSFASFTNRGFYSVLILFIFIMILWIIFEFFIIVPYLNISKRILNKWNIILFLIILYVLAQKFLIINLILFVILGSIIVLLPFLILLRWSLSQLVVDSKKRIGILVILLFAFISWFLLYENYHKEIYFELNGKIIEKDINLSESPVTFWNPNRSCLDVVPEECEFIRSTGGDESGWFSCVIGCPK